MWDSVSRGAGAATGLSEYLFQLLCRLLDRVCSDVATILCCLWRRQNDKVWEVMCRKKQTQGKHQGTVQWNSRWRSLKDGYVKCNVDAALFGDQNCFSIDMCI